MKINTYFLELMFILLNISQLEKLMKIFTLTEILFQKRKDKKYQKKNLVVNLLESIRVEKAMMQDYDVSRIQAFISKFKDRQLKKLNKKLKELEDKIEKFAGQITQ